MDWYLTLFALFSIVIGGVLVFAARWADRMNTRIGGHEQQKNKGKFYWLMRPAPIKSVSDFFLATLPPFESFIGKALAISVIVLVVTFIGWVFFRSL